MSNKKILLVDDDLVLVKGMAHKLRARGFSVLSAHDGGTAIKRVREENPDLLILDINFPIDVSTTWNAFSILQWLQRLNEDWKKPVIIITAGETTEYEEKARAAGAVAFFRKPIAYDELVAVIHRELGQGATPAKKSA
jgi:two-component system, OmpR family, KDP operon response regulator KdpE